MERKLTGKSFQTDIRCVEKGKRQFFRFISFVHFITSAMYGRGSYNSARRVRVCSLKFGLNRATNRQPSEKLPTCYAQRRYYAALVSQLTLPLLPDRIEKSTNLTLPERCLFCLRQYDCTKEIIVSLLRRSRGLQLDTKIANRTGN